MLQPLCDPPSAMELGQFALNFSPRPSRLPQNNNTKTRAEARQENNTERNLLLNYNDSLMSFEKFLQTKSILNIQHPLVVLMYGWLWRRIPWNLLNAGALKCTNPHYLYG